MTYNIQTVQSARIARFGSGGVIARSPVAMNDDLLFKACPAIFANDKHTSRSDKFTYIPTIDVLNGLRREGFQPYEVRQGGSRDTEKRGFTKHLIRLRRDGERQVGDSIRELILLNAHDGTSSYQLMSGLFRLVCSNGLVLPDGTAQSIRIPHKGDVINDVIEGAYEVIREGDAIDGAVDGMRALTLHKDEQEAFAAAALQLRFDEGKAPITPAQALSIRRRGDDQNDIRTTFNVVQENLVKGDVGYIERDQNGRRKAYRHTRPVNSIDGNVSLNRALFTLAQEMQKLKAA